MNKRGLTFIDLIVAIGIVGILFAGIFLSYSSILDSINNSELRTGAAGVLNRQMEIIRNLPYDKVGTVGGVPAGVVPQTQTVLVGNANFLVKTTIRNVDDPFDGTLGGTPNDTAPADYKLIGLEVSCSNCASFVPLSFTATVAPKNLEGAIPDGSLFINVFDANGKGVPGAFVTVKNASVTPPIDLADTTNAEGVLQLVGVPTSTQRYAVAVGKSGYSSDRTYPPGDPANPNPVKPNATVAAQTVTQVSFGIDRTSSLAVKTLDHVCAPLSGKNFSVKGSKLVGTSPDVLKFSTSSATGAAGSKLFSGIEWDTYAITLAEPSLDVLGTIPFSPLTINPSSTADFSFVLQPSAPDSLLVTVKDAATGGGVQGASVTLSKAGFSKTLTAGRHFITETDWSGGNFSSQDGGIAVASPAGALTLVSNNGAYSTSTTSWLISNTIDVGSSTSAFYSFTWNPTSEPPPTGSESARFQLAANNDNATWNFVGPDGTAGSFFTAGGGAASGLNNNRYLRYKVYLKTDNQNFTPEVDDVAVEFTSICVPKSQVLFTNLAAGTYSLSVSASGYIQATSSVDISGAWNQTEVLLSS